MLIFDFDNYLDYLKHVANEGPWKERGTMAFADACGINKSVYSQIQRNIRHPTSEQAYVISDVLELKTNETDYFLALVEHARSRNASYKSYLKKRLALIKSESQIKSPKQRGAAPDLNRFFSQWYYTAIFLCTSLKDYSSVEAMAARLRLPRKLVLEVTEYLCAIGFCKKSREGHLQMAIQSPSPPKDLSVIERYRLSWRLKGLERLPAPEKKDLFLSHCFSVSHQDFEKIQKMIRRTLEEIDLLLPDSPPEKVVNLNFDFFSIVD